MTVRDLMNRWLGRNGVSDDSDQLVEIAVVPLATGPMSVESLCAAGFHASGGPTFNIVTDVASDFRIVVPRDEAAAATKRLDEFGI